MTLKFEEWITHQQSREDRVGNFARKVSKVDLFPRSSRHKWDEHKGWADIVTRIPEPDYIPDFNLAWREYIQAKETPLDSLD